PSVAAEDSDSGTDSDKSGQEVQQKQLPCDDNSPDLLQFNVELFDEQNNRPVQTHNTLAQHLLGSVLKFAGVADDQSNRKNVYAADESAIDSVVEETVPRRSRGASNPGKHTKRS